MAASVKVSAEHLIANLDAEETPTGFTITDAGTYVLGADLNPLANDETVVFRLYVKLFAAQASRLVYEAVFKHAQVELIKLSPPVPAPIEFKATIEQKGGTKRTFPLAIYAL